MLSGRKFRLFPQKYGFFPFVWMFYLLLPAFNLQEERGLKLIIGAALLLLFAVTYRQLYWAGDKAFNYWLGLQMLLIVVLSLCYNPVNFFMGFFSSNFVGWYAGKREFKIAYVVFCGVILVPLVIAAWGMNLHDLLFFFPFLIIMLVSPFGIKSLGRRKILEKQLDQANEVIEELVKREERMRIARDLHDTMGHTLSLITLKSQLVERLVAKDPERAQAEAREIQRTSRAALRQVRELVSEMRAVTVAEELAEAGKMLRAAEIALEVQGEVSLEDVPDLTQNILSLCIKEAVTNIVKHSRATRCRIRIALTEGAVRITVEDNGIGLTPDEAGRERRDGNGMKGMAERLSLVEGSMTLSSNPGGGTALSVVIPRIIKEHKEGELA